MLELRLMRSPSLIRVRNKEVECPHHVIKAINFHLETLLSISLSSSNTIKHIHEIAATNFYPLDLDHPIIASLLLISIIPGVQHSEPPKASQTKESNAHCR